MSTLFSHAPFKIRRTSSSSPSPTDGADNTRLVTVTSVMLSFVVIVDVVVVVGFFLVFFRFKSYGRMLTCGKQCADLLTWKYAGLFLSTLKQSLDKKNTGAQPLKTKFVESGYGAQC